MSDCISTAFNAVQGNGAWSPRHVVHARTSSSGGRCFAEFYTLMFQQVVNQLDGDTEVVVHALDWDLDAPAHDRAVRDLETA